MRYVLKVCYDGTNYCGWQVQKNGITVQSELLRAAEEAFGETVVITASGRTDAGVHAAGQICHMDMEKTVPPDRVAAALNAHLPQDIAVLSSAAAPADFDANRSAKKKTYIYSVYFSHCRNPLKDRYAVWVQGSTDIQKMREGAELFVGVHDFKAYCASGSAVKTTVREIFSIEVTERDGLVNFAVCGGGFLYNMVRTMVGTMLGYASGRISREDIINSLNKGDRKLVGKTMPAKGLTLYSVDYCVELFQNR